MGQIAVAGDYLWQGLFVGGSLAGVALIRKSIGEEYVSSLDLQTALTRPFEQMAIGPVTSLAMFFLRPWGFLRNGFVEHPQFFIPILAGLMVTLALLCSRWRTPGTQAFPIRRLGRLALAGLAMLTLAYPLSFTVSASVTSGRDTRIHLAAALGGAILWGCACALVLSRVRGSWMRYPAVTALALLFTGMFAFGFNVQRDYRLAWEYQRGFWTDLTHLCPTSAAEP